VSASFASTVAVVTGAGRGIGRAVARELARAGADVALLARSRDELAETSAQVRALGGTALIVPTDLADLGQIDTAAKLIRDELGTADVLVNNAGAVQPLGPTDRIDPLEWARAITVNLTAAVSLTLALLPAMLANRRGHIVNVSSGIVESPSSMIGGNAYITGKTALEAHTLNLAAELADSGVAVNVFRPGIVDTAMQGWIRGQDPKEIGAQLHERFVRYHADGVLITPEQSARSLVEHLHGTSTGEIWTVSAPS
jgi:NAD(P)-dependent dehydrogenase (short-subunit alcohol dehydrogenase family)